MSNAQLSVNMDEILNEKSVEIGKAEDAIAEAEKKKSDAWEKVFELFDEFNLHGQEARFIAEDGHTLTRQERKNTHKIDEAKLKALIFQKYPQRRAVNIWNSIVTETIDSTKIEAAIQIGKLDAELVTSCHSPDTISYARVRKEWTKEDRERAAILGIEKK